MIGIKHDNKNVLSEKSSSIISEMLIIAYLIKAKMHIL